MERIGRRLCRRINYSNWWKFLTLWSHR